MRNRFRAAAVTLAAGLLTLLPLAGTGMAATSAITPASCNARPYNYILTYFANPGKPQLPLRCGDSGFGLNHIVRRGHFDGDTISMIQTTLKYGQQKDPGAKILFNDRCEGIYTVAYGYNALNGNDQNANPVGIVTAYRPNNKITTKVPNGHLGAGQASSYRTDCRIFIPIGD